jgi:hypothetical protein
LIVQRWVWTVQPNGSVSIKPYWQSISGRLFGILLCRTIGRDRGRCHSRGELSAAAPLHHISPVGKGGPPRADRLELGFLLVVQHRIEPIKRGAHLADRPQHRVEALAGGGEPRRRGEVVV